MSWGQFVRIALVISGAAIAWWGWGVRRDGENRTVLHAYWDVMKPISTIHVGKKTAASFSIPKTDSWQSWGGGPEGRRLVICGIERVKISSLRRNGAEISFEERNVFRGKPGDLIELELEATEPAVQEVVVQAVEDLTETNGAAMVDGFNSIVGGMLMFLGCALSVVVLAVWGVILHRKRNAISTPT